MKIVNFNLWVAQKLVLQDFVEQKVPHQSKFIGSCLACSKTSFKRTLQTNSHVNFTVILVKGHSSTNSLLFTTLTSMQTIISLVQCLPLIN